MKKEECPKCDELLFVFMRSIPGAGGTGDVDLWECRGCQYEEAIIVLRTDWGLTDDSIARIKSSLERAAEKYEPGMMKMAKAPSEYPCCDALHEFDAGLERI